MRRFYVKQNGMVVICSLIFSFLCLTTVDWKYQGQSLPQVMYVIVRYMNTMGILIGAAGAAVSVHYFGLLKERQEGSFLYALPVKRAMFWKSQWAAVHVMMAFSWAVSMASLFLSGRSYLYGVHAGWLLLSGAAYFFVDAAVVTFFMWMQMKITSKRNAFLLSVGTIAAGVTVLKEISKCMIVYLHDTGIGLYALLRNAVSAFLYPHQAMDEFYRALLMYGGTEDVRVFASGWQTDRYGLLFLSMAAVLLAVIFLMHWDGGKLCQRLPGTGKLSGGFVIGIVWSVLFLLMSKFSFFLLRMDSIPELIDSIGVMDEEGDIYMILSGFSYFNYDSGYPYRPWILALIAICSLVLAVVLYRIFTKKAVSEHENPEKEAQCL